jgi:magnesium transporter
LFHYDKDFHEERKLATIDQAFNYTEKTGITWLIIEGLNNQEVLRKVGDTYRLHPLVLEDI